MKNLIRGFLCFAIVAVASSARAQSWALLANYHIGEEYFAQGDYENALKAFDAAYEALPVQVILFDLALTQYKLDNVYLAREYLRRFERKLSHKDPHFADAEKLGSLLAAAVDEDLTAQENAGRTFACDLRYIGVCGRANWPDDVKRTWAAAAK